MSKNLGQRDWDGDRLRQWRIKNHVTMAAAAERCGISFQSLSRIERGYVPHIDLANRIVRMTRGEIRYRDIYQSFHPEYA